MSGKLIIEFAEIDKYTRKDAAKVKSFITTVNDAGTMKFKDYVSDHYRRCVVVCTTNSDKPLKDATGNRRFLPVIVRRMIDEAWLRENVEQILAEAAHYEAAGHSFGIPAELWATADQHQEAVRDRTPEEDAVQSWFGADVTETSESRWLWASDLSAAFRHQRMNEKAKIGRVMASMGYESDRRTIGGRRDRCWFKNGTTVTGRQWLPTLEQGKAVAKWTLLPLPFTPAQQHAMDMRNAPPMPPVFRTTSYRQ
jgi:predicted P-loop ATPase